MRSFIAQAQQFEPVIPQALHQYIVARYVEKRKLHNRALHAPGIVTGHGDELRVQARGRGDLSVEVGAGYAIDGQGNDILAFEKQIKTVTPSDFKLPQTTAGPHWSLLLDTNAPEEAAGTQFAFESAYRTAGRSFVLLTAGEVK